MKEAGKTADLLMSCMEIPDVTDVGAMTGSRAMRAGGNGESVSDDVLLEEKRELWMKS